MNSSRPYLIRAINEWIVDNGFTPQIVVDAQADGVEVPTGYVKDGQIVLNISPGAIRDLTLGNDLIEFNARFGGSPFHVVVPTCAVLAVAARENGAGMSFPEESHEDDPPPESTDKGKSRPSLRIVK
jgi:stringent starvation protein B